MAVCMFGGSAAKWVTFSRNRGGRVARITVVGSANTDMVLQLSHLPQPGETVLGGRFTTAGGGKGANQAVAAARLGAAVTFVARLGADTLGDQALAAYQAEGIDCRYLTRDAGEPSGVALIFVAPDGENVIGVAPGANARLAPDTIPVAVQDAAVVLTQLEIPLACVAAAVEAGRARGIPVILNPAPARPLPDALLRGVIVTPNVTEAALLTGLDAAAIDADRAADALLARGVAAAVVTLGERGALLATPTERRPVPSFPVEVVDTTAAGDAFNGGLAVALAEGASLVDAVGFAAAVGALTVTRLGAQPSLPARAEVEQFLKETRAHG